MARLRRKYPPKRTLPEAAHQQSPSSMLPSYASRDRTAMMVDQSAAPSPSLLQPLLSNTSSTSSVSIRSGSVGFGVASAPSIEFYLNRPDVRDERYNASRQPEFVGPPLVTSNGTSDGQLHAVGLRTGTIHFPAAQHSSTAASAPSNGRQSIVAGHYSMAANDEVPNVGTTSWPCSPEKTLSAASRKLNRHTATNILGNSSSAIIAALTHRHRHDI
ncbi:hypothetical protein V1509DRAFT_617387 [Lipomyces kononenkoae]